MSLNPTGTNLSVEDPPSVVTELIYKSLLNTLTPYVAYKKLSASTRGSVDRVIQNVAKIVAEYPQSAPMWDNIQAISIVRYQRDTE